MKAFAYYRTSSHAGVGDDKDSEERQRLAVTRYAAQHQIEIVAEHYDAAVSGADSIEDRPGFAAMLEAIAGNGVRTIIVETANRFARDLIVQETGYRHLRAQGIELIAADSPGAFLDDTPTAVMVRQILGAVAQFEKASAVARMNAAKKRLGRPGGQTSLVKMRPEVVQRMIDLRSQHLTLRAIAEQLAVEGYLTPSGRLYNPAQIARVTA